MLHGVWIDDSPARLLTKEYWLECKHHNFVTAAIMLESTDAGFDPRISEEAIEKIGQLTRDVDIELVLTVWPEPRKDYIDGFAKKIGTYIQKSGASGLEADLEGLWLPNRLKGYSSMDLAGDALVEMFVKLSGAHDVRTEVTTYPYHQENNRTADVAPHVDRVLPQAYSVRNRTKDGKNWEVPWDHAYGPSNMQKLTIERAMQIKDFGKTNGPMLSCGLAAYDQEWPGHLGEEALRIAYRTALRYNPLEIRFWSSKWIFGSKKNGYASRFMKSL